MAQVKGYGNAQVTAEIAEACNKWLNSLTPEQKGRAIIHDKAPWDIPTDNSSKAAVHDNEGVAGSELTGIQDDVQRPLA